MPDGAGQLAQRLGGGITEDDDVEPGLHEVTTASVAPGATCSAPSVPPLNSTSAVGSR